MRNDDSLSQQVRARLAALLAGTVGEQAEPPPEAPADEDAPGALVLAGGVGLDPGPPPSGASLGATRRPFGRAQLLVVAGILAAGLGVACWAVLSARAVPVTAPPVKPSVVAPASVQPATSPATEVLVHVVGAVATPGVVRLRQGARVADAIAAAGGLATAADIGELNLAEPIPDGAQLAVGTAATPRGEVRAPSVAAPPAGGSGGAPGGGGAAGAAGNGLVDLNTATLAQLDALPGVGPVTAQHILDHRSQKGRFTRIQELQEVDGVGPKLYEKIAAHVRV